MITSSPTFCTAPWTSLNIDQTGLVMPCMHSDYKLGNIKHTPIQEILAGPKLLDLKQTIARGQWHSACAWCQQLEKTTGASGRTVRSASPEVLAEINNDLNWFGLEHIVVNWSNLCNLTCVYCNPETSTAWQSVKHIPINHIKNEHQDLIELARQQGHMVQGLTLGGGEPLLQKGLVDFLSYLDKTKVRVLVTTNLSVDLTNNAVYQELKTWRHVDWMISFDNADADKFEYVRQGASWQQFERNIAVMKSDQQKVIAHPAYSIYCAMDLEQYYDYCASNSLDLFWCELTHPWDLDIRRQSSNLKQQAIDEIDKVLNKYQGVRGLALDTLARYRMTLQDTSYLISPDYPVDLLKFHSDIEQQLKPAHRFVDLWPCYVKDTTS
jgi:radical SAM protein with 4Fe4S-binding SPASM domain